MTQIESFKFDGKEYPVVVQGDDRYLPLKQMCDSIGLNLQAQQRLIERSAWSKGKTAIMAVQLPGNHQSRRTFVVDIKVVPMWIANIDASRVKNRQARQNVELWQEEFSDALYEYVTQGVAVNPRADDKQVQRRVTEVLTKRKERVESATLRAKGLQALRGTGIDEELKTRALVLLGEIMAGNDLWVWDYLAEKFPDHEDVSNHVIKFGQRVAAFYRQERSTEPRSARRPGSNVPRNVYDEADRYILDAAWESYAEEWGLL